MTKQTVYINKVMVQFCKVPVNINFEEFLKMNNSWPELFNFQNSFNCLELLKTAPLPIHKVIIITIF